MKVPRLILCFVLIVCAVGCRTTQQPSSLYDEEVVLQVWDVLDNYYGSETLFECEYLPVHEGKIQLIKGHAISRIAVVSHSPSQSAPILFRAVPSNPSENEFTVEGTTLRFHPCRNGQRLFVACVPELPSTHPSNNQQEDNARK